MLSITHTFSLNVLSMSEYVFPYFVATRRDDLFAMMNHSPVFAGKPEFQRGWLISFLFVGEAPFAVTLFTH